MLERAREGHRALFHHRKGILLAAAGVLVCMSAPVEALPFNMQPWARQPEVVRQPVSRPSVARPAKPSAVAARQKTEQKERAEDVASKARGVLGVIISIDKQQLTLYSDGRPIARSRVSTGTASHPTPTGVFSVIQKNRWHRSNLYANAPMFYMQRITWSGVAMHQGIVPNYPASHGCIRLPEAFARQLWGITKMGARVIIARGEVTPVEISHGRLFTFKREPLEATLEPGESSTERVKAGHGALEVVQLAGQKATASDAGSLAVPDATTAAPREASSVAEVRPLKSGPISVFVSRKEGKLFVRKGFEPVFDVPVTFEQPERSLGTHVFTALAMKEDDATFRWNVVSLPSGGRKIEKGKKVEWSVPSSTAAEALDRITIPTEALERISPLMSAGASVIISDKGLGPETGKGTDFIVLTR
jgi:lipoprotein-anchoring transpeptidase ErfK/SrfK